MIPIETLDEIDSTNSELMRRARAGRSDPILLVARHQTAGRGRLGRQWVSEPNTSLTFSLGLPLQPTNWSGLSLAVGVSVAESLHPVIALKWPNDLWLHRRKLGGILIETLQLHGAQRYAVIGIGLNLDQPPVQDLSMPPAWLREILPDINAAAALERIAESLWRNIQAFEQYGFEPFQARFQARDALAKLFITSSDGLSGTAHGVDDSGALLVHTAAGMQLLTSAEVSVRLTS